MTKLRCLLVGCFLLTGCAAHKNKAQVITVTTSSDWGCPAGTEPVITFTVGQEGFVKSCEPTDGAVGGAHE
jgi:hypothetical protein